MSKRFHDTDIWEEDWFIALPKDYRDFWFFIKDKCDHGGIWRPNMATFNKLYECSVSLAEALKLFNRDCKENEKRIEVLKNGRWFLTGFIPFQYGESLNLTNRLHRSIYELLIINEVNLTSIRPQIEVIQGPMIMGAKDKEKDKEIKKGIVKGKQDLSDEEFLKSLPRLYPHVNIAQEMNKMDAWLLVHRGRQKTRRFIINWLNKIDSPINIKKPERVRKAKPDCTVCNGTGKITEGVYKGAQCFCVSAD